MKIFITGNNFLTKNFNEKFSKRYELVFSGGVNLSNVTEVNAALNGGFDAVIHLASKQAHEPNATADNLIYFRNLQYACRMNNIPKLLYCMVGSDRAPVVPIVDAYEPDLERTTPVDMYGKTNNLIYQLASKDSFTTILRLFHVYGKYQTAREGFIGGALQSVILGRKAKKIRVPFDQTVNLTYAEDTVKMINKFLGDEMKKGTYNLCSDEKISLLAAAKLMQKTGKRYDKDAEIVVESDELVPECTASNARFKCFFEDFEFVSVKNGINRLFKMYTEDKTLFENYTD